MQFCRTTHTSLVPGFFSLIFSRWLSLPFGSLDPLPLRLVIASACAARAKHNLKNIDVDIPRDALVVFTGISGSGKSSLASGTVYAEAQRRYFELVAPYARRLMTRSGNQTSFKSKACRPHGVAAAARHAERTLVA